MIVLKHHIVGYCQIEEPQVSTSDLNSSNDCDVTEDLMQTHEVFLNNLRSRLTKLQVNLSSYMVLCFSILLDMPP